MTILDGSDVFSQDDDELNRLYNFFDQARYLTFRAREKELERYAISHEQEQILFVVRVLGPKATPAEISRILFYRPHAISLIVDRMVEKGLVKKSNDLAARNWVRVALTDKGREAYQLTVKRGPIHRIFSTLDERERKEFRGYLEKIMAKARKELNLDHDDLPLSD